MAQAKKALKKPTGEFSKTTSGYADYLKKRRPNISKSEAAAQAGKVRDAGYSTSDFKKENPRKKTMATRKKDPLVKLAQGIKKRVGTTAREARDVVTGVGTVATTKNKALKKMAVGNLKMQVKEVKTAATKGKTGTKPVVKVKKSGSETLSFGGKR